MLELKNYIAVILLKASHIPVAQITPFFVSKIRLTITILVHKEI